MFQQRLIILFSAAVAARFGGWVRIRCWVLGACAVSSRSGGGGGGGRAPGVLSFCFFVVLRDCVCVVASEWGRWWRPSLLGFLALGVDILGAIWRVGVGDALSLSFFFFYFRALWFGLG